jgi:hypothetical protein
MAGSEEDGSGAGEAAAVEGFDGPQPLRAVQVSLFGAGSGGGGALSWGPFALDAAGAAAAEETGNGSSHPRRSAAAPLFARGLTSRFVVDVPCGALPRGPSALQVDLETGPGVSAEQLPPDAWQPLFFRATRLADGTAFWFWAGCRFGLDSGLRHVLPALGFDPWKASLDFEVGAGVPLCGCGVHLHSCVHLLQPFSAAARAGRRPSEPKQHSSSHIQSSRRLWLKHQLTNKKHS